MRTLRLLVRQIGYEQRLFWRNPSSAGFTFAFPILLLVIFATMNRRVTLGALGGISYAQFYVPGIIAFSVMSACYTSLAITLCFRRDLGVLKRLRGTPLPAWMFMAGNIGSSLVASALLVVITTAVGVAFYGLRVPDHLAALALALAVGAFCFCSLALAITVVIPNATAAPAIVNLTLLPLLFISGTFFPLEPGSVFESISAIFPLRPFQQAVFAAFDPLGTGRGVDTGALVPMLAWGAGALVLAVRRFRWEPRYR
jgi:ABC-2 type transport system permease protein